jgi:hypothetical protein
MENTQVKDLNPYEFTLEIDGVPHAIRVEVPKDGDYVVYVNGERTGHISSTETGGKRYWITKDDIEQSLVNQIGEQVEILEAGEVH